MNCVSVKTVQNTQHSQSVADNSYLFITEAYIQLASINQQSQQLVLTATNAMHTIPCLAEIII